MNEAITFSILLQVWEVLHIRSVRSYDGRLAHAVLIASTTSRSFPSPCGVRMSYSQRCAGAVSTIYSGSGDRMDVGMIRTLGSVRSAV